MSNEVRIDLPDLGEGHFLLMRNPKTLPYGVQKEVAIATGGDESDIAKRLKAVDVILRRLVVGGNLVNAWNGEPIAFPLDDTGIDALPGEAVAAVVNKFGEMRAEAEKVAKKS